MIPAREALSLPGAKVSESDAEAARKIVEELDAHVREKMTRLGVEKMFPASRWNGVIMSEVVHAIRRAGWHGRAEPVMEQSRVTGGKVVVGWTIIIAPEESAYDEHDLTRVCVSCANTVEVTRDGIALPHRSSVLGDPCAGVGQKAVIK